jgi:hypothetical protein
MSWILTTSAGIVSDAGSMEMALMCINIKLGAED